VIDGAVEHLARAAQRVVRDLGELRR